MVRSSPTFKRRFSDTVKAMTPFPVPPGDAGPTPAELAEWVLALSDVTCLVADEESGAPRICWGDRFFFVGPDRRRPFVTIVEHDTPGFDEASGLDRPGVFRLNIDLGREEFHRQFGYPPVEFPERRAGIDFSRLDAVLPNPTYAGQGWAGILNPSLERLPELDRLVAQAHRRAVARRDRMANRHHTTR